MVKTTNKKFAIGAGIVCAALILGSSMAYFTDNATTQAKGTAGTVAINLQSDINFLNKDGKDILNPGDQRVAKFTVENKGNKSADVRTTIALTALDHAGQPINFTGDAVSQSEFDLYNATDVTLVEGKGYQPNLGAKPIEVKSVADNVITYKVADYSLDGDDVFGADRELVEGAATTDNHVYDYVLVFKGETGNDWQKSSIQMDVLVEAKQHENTSAGWDIVAQEQITAGSISQNGVAAETVITPAK